MQACNSSETAATWCWHACHMGRRVVASYLGCVGLALVAKVPSHELCRVQRLLEATGILRIILPEGATVLEATLRVLPVPVCDPHFSQKFRPQQSGHSEQSSVES